MDDYLEADCVIAALTAQGFLKQYDWKHLNTREFYYPTHFYHTSRKATISFFIYIKNRRHCITKSQLRVIAQCHNLNVDDIFIRCIIQEHQ
jgi:hypothetical protein